MTVQYREHAPAAELASRVRCYWTILGTAPESGAQVNRVMPDGCMDVVFDLRAVKSAGRVVGAMLQAAVIGYARFVDTIGIRFVPGAAPYFLRTRASELTGLVEDASAIWRDAQDLVDALRAAPDQAQRMSRLNAYLIRRLDRAECRSPAAQGMALIERARGQIRIDALGQALNLSDRSLQRSFAQDVGLTPKQAVRITRFRSALQLMSKGTPDSLARIAFSCGYADQAHFTRDFHDLAAIAPSAYLREHNLVGFVQDQADGHQLSLQ